MRRMSSRYPAMSWMASIAGRPPSGAVPVGIARKACILTPSGSGIFSLLVWAMIPGSPLVACARRRCARRGRLFDVPLHAGLPVGGNRDSNGDELLLLLGKGDIRERSTLHLEERLVDARLGGEQLRVRCFSPAGHVFELAHHARPAACRTVAQRCPTRRTRDRGCRRQALPRIDCGEVSTARHGAAEKRHARRPLRPAPPQAPRSEWRLGRSRCSRIRTRTPGSSSTRASEP